MKKARIKWRKKLSKHHYGAASSYLHLLYKTALADELTIDLQQAHPAKFPAKDIFRASCLPLLSIENSHVKKNYLKILAGRRIAPLLLVRDSERGCVVVADGYHRLCAVYALDEDAPIHCKIA